ESGALVPGASVTVKNIATGIERNSVTNGQGTFVVPLLPPATYTIAVNREGFAPTEIRDVTLNVGGQRSIQIQLKVGQLGAKVEVTTEAPLINESPAVG